jgi:outer membrane protein OmpA-like peptidoglycan-associated protein
MTRGMRRRGRIGAHGADHESLWISYSDLLSAVLLVFALFLMVTILHNQQEAEALEEIDKMIEETLGVKSRIIQELMKAFKGSNLNMRVDPQTGAITFEGGVFFDTNSSQVSEQGKKNLAQFIPKYIEILLSDQFRPHIAQIIIEGHTDTAGGYLYNLKLSQNRASSVVETIYGPGFPNFPHKEYLKQVITANGRSFMAPVRKPDGSIDAAKSRRVEFKFRLKEDETIEKIQKLVDEDAK